MKHTVFRFGIFSSVFLCLALSVAAAQNQQPMSAAPSAPLAGAIISDWKGNIRLNLPGQSPSSPVREEVLPPGTLLETGNGRLLLRLSDGSQVLVRAHTRLQVQQPAPADRSYFHLLLGRIRAFINKQTGGAPPFELGTPSAVIAVRGTQFDVEVNRQQVTEVDVFEGLVEVYGLGAPGASVLVEPGFSTRIGIDGPPEQPRPTDEMRPDIERPEREVDSGDSREDELELAFETSEMMELEEVSQEPEVELQEGPDPEKPPR
jgi:hypothetical protein